MRFDRTTAERILSGRKTEHRIPRRDSQPVAKPKPRARPNSWRVSAPELEAKGVVSAKPVKVAPVEPGQSIPITVMQANADLGYRRLKPSKDGSTPSAEKERARQPRKEGEAICHVSVVDIRPGLLHEINQNQAVAEGFKSRADFFHYWWLRYREGPGLPGNPEYPIFIPVWVVRFELDPTHRPRLLSRASDVNHGYTESAELAVDPSREGEAVEEEWDQRFALEAEQGRLFAAAERAKDRRERHELEQRLLRATEEAKLRGVDVSSPLRVIERQVEKIERRVYEGKAA